MKKDNENNAMELYNSVLSLAKVDNILDAILEYRIPAKFAARRVGCSLDDIMENGLGELAYGCESAELSERSINFLTYFAEEVKLAYKDKKDIVEEIDVSFVLDYLLN